MSKVSTQNRDVETGVVYVMLTPTQQDISLRCDDKDGDDDDDDNNAKISYTNESYQVFLHIKIAVVHA